MSYISVEDMLRNYSLTANEGKLVKIKSLRFVAVLIKLMSENVSAVMKQQDRHLEALYRER